MEQFDNHLPHYVKIKHYLRQLIVNAQPHTQMPSELELAKQFNVSRGTAKQAIMDLVYEGLYIANKEKGLLFRKEFHVFMTSFHHLQMTLNVLDGFLQVSFLVLHTMRQLRAQSSSLD